MAISIDAGGRRGRRSRRRTRPMAEINVTPMVDVMLVLLIIFMITAPLLRLGVKIELPETYAKPMQDTDEPLVVEVDEAGHAHLQGKQFDLPILIARLQAVRDVKRDSRIVVRGDKRAEYGSVLKTWGAIRAAGFDRAALETSQLRQIMRSDPELRQFLKPEGKR